MVPRSPLIRVLVLFMAGIILPTGFLVYLGILSIRAETQLLRKEAQERVGKTAEAISDQAQGVVTETLAPLLQLTRRLSPPEKKSPYEIHAAMADYRRSNPAVSLLILLDGNHHMVYPVQDIRRNPAPAMMPVPLSLQQRIEQAEQAEFKDRNYSSAIQAYRSLVREVDSGRWKAILLASLAGNLVKQGQYDAAEAQYQEILARYSDELDRQGYPFGLVIASQLGDLQQAKGRPDLALASHLRIFQELLAARWDLGRDESQFFARRLKTRIEALRSQMTAVDESLWHALRAQEEQRVRDTAQATDFVLTRWPALQHDLRRENLSGSPAYAFANSPSQRATVYAPAYAARTGELEWTVLEELETAPFRTRLRAVVEPLASAANLAYRFELAPGTILAQSHQTPASDRWPIADFLRQTVPPIKLSIAPIFDVPVERAAERRRQVYVGMVLLAAIVILIALYATWYAVSREIEVAQLKARFVAGISHELKTPLSIISYLGQKLQLGRYESAAEVQDYYAMISEETARLKFMIEDVLDFSRLMENRQPFRRDPVNLVALVRETAERFRHSLKEGEVEFSCRLEPLECSVLGDPDAISRALLNLLDNAVKYSPPGRKTVQLSLHIDAGMAVLQVADEGYGIGPEEQKLVFDRFYRGRSASDQQSTHGAGLGLSIVHHIVMAHGGGIDLQSTPGKGSIFTIRIPVNKTHA